MSDLPRRLRYKKNKQENEPDKNVDLEKIWNMPQEYKKELEKKTTELALNEMRSFREKYNRYPDKKEMDEIAENIFEQVKAKDERTAAHKRDNVQTKNVSQGKSFLDERKSRRDRPTQPQEQVQKPQEVKADSVLERRLKRNAEKAQREAALKKEKPKEKIKPRDEENEEEAFEEKKPSKKLDVKDLLSDEKEDDLDLDDEDDTGLNDFSEEKDDTDLGGLEDLDEDEESENCPNCKRVAQKTFFCPKCGKGFCGKCAKKFEKLTGNQAKIVCPKCSNEFKTSVN